MKYYWLLEASPKDWDVTNDLLAMEATRVSTNTFGNDHVRRFIKCLSDEDVVMMKLQYGHRLSIYPVTTQESTNLIDRGYIKKS
jgi:predicted RNA-binding protein with PUA-like domain